MSDGYLQCPKRDIEVPTLIVQTIPRSLCTMRQREGFHKCPSCLNRTLPVDAFVPMMTARQV